MTRMAACTDSYLLLPAAISLIGAGPPLLQGGKYSASHVLDILRGSKSQKVTSSGHQNLPGYGVGKALNKTDCERLLRKLVTSSILEEETFRQGPPSFVVCAIVHLW